MEGKKVVQDRKGRIIVTCARGITAFLKEEISALGFPLISEGPTSVETEGTLDDTMLLNLHIRTGQRVLYLLRSFRAAGVREFYTRIRSIPWEEYISERGHLSVTSHTDIPAIRDSRFANQKCKDAIVDRIRERTGRRPDSGPERRGAVIFLYWVKGECALYIDTSGEPLHRRHYRRRQTEAPMQETLAAALIMATRWQKKGHFVNPMCGSGTIAIEAALMALNRAPGILRDNFGFMHIRGFRRTRWEEMKRRAEKTSKEKLSCPVTATDSDPAAIEAARCNAEAAGVEDAISFHVCDFTETTVPPPPGVVILNPGYGRRMGNPEELEMTYTRIGDFFKQKCPGYYGYVFTGEPVLAGKVGLRTSRRLTFFNGPIECRLLEYELYEGTRKRKRRGVDYSPGDI